MDQKIYRIMFIHNSITHEIFIDYIKAYLDGNDLKFSVLNMILIRQRKDKFIARDVIDIDVLLYLFTKDELKSFLEKHNSITNNKFIIAHSFMSVYTADNIRKIMGGICV